MYCGVVWCSKVRSCTVSKVLCDVVSASERERERMVTVRVRVSVEAYCWLVLYGSRGGIERSGVEKRKEKRKEGYKRWGRQIQLIDSFIATSI